MDSQLLTPEKKCGILSGITREKIIQLANETPSHIIAPALHMTRQQIGALFNKTFNIPYTEIPEELCAFARGKLRQKFLSTKLGISGVNFAAIFVVPHLLIVNFSSFLQVNDCDLLTEFVT